MNENNEIFRVDLLLQPESTYGYRVIEFKTGKSSAKNLEQLCKYLKLLDKLNSNSNTLPPSEGVIIYLDLQKCCMSHAAHHEDYLDIPIWKGAR